MWPFARPRTASRWGDLPYSIGNNILSEAYRKRDQGGTGEYPQDPSGGLDSPMAGFKRRPGGEWRPNGSGSQFQLCKVNPQIIVDIDLYFVLEGVSCGFKLRFLQMVYINRFFVRIDDPVFPHSCVSI